MSKSATPNWFKLATIVAFGGFTVLLALTVQQISNYTHVRAQQYAEAGDKERGIPRKISNYRLAHVLDHTNSAYRIKLSNAYLLNNDTSGAISALGKTEREKVMKARIQRVLGRFDDASGSLEGSTSSAADFERARLVIEQGSGEEAVQATNAAQTDNELLLLGIAYILNDQADQAEGVALQINSPGVRRQLEVASTNKTGLGEILLQEGLTRSAVRVLRSASESTAKFQLLAKAYTEIQPQTESNLQEARKAAAEGVKLSPSNIAIREALRDINKKLELDSAAAEQQNRINDLKKGNV